METARTLPDYNGPVVVHVDTEADEIRVSFHQDGKWVSFSDAVLDAAVRDRDALKDKIYREQRLAVARVT